MAYYKVRDTYPSGAQTSRPRKADNIVSLPRISKTSIASIEDFGIEGKQFHTPLSLTPSSPFNAAIEFPVQPHPQSPTPSNMLFQLLEPVSVCICGNYLCFVSVRDKEVRSLLVNYQSGTAYQSATDFSLKFPKLSHTDMAEQIEHSFRVNHDSDMVTVTSKRLKEECVSLQIKLTQNSISLAHNTVEINHSYLIRLLHFCFLRLDAMSSQLINERINNQLRSGGKALKNTVADRESRECQTDNFTLKIHEQCVTEMERLSKQLSEQISELKTLRTDNDETVSIPCGQVESVLEDALRSLSGVLHLAYKDQSADPKSNNPHVGVKIELDYVVETLNNMKNRLGISDNEKINYIVNVITNNSLYKPDMNSFESDTTLKRFLQALLDPSSLSRIARVTDKTNEFITRLQKSKAASKKKQEEKELEKVKQKEPLKEQGEERAPHPAEEWSGGSLTVGSNSVPDSLLSKLLVPELLPKFGPDLKKRLLELDLWNFNVENVHALTSQSLFQVTYSLFNFYNLIKTFRIPETILIAFLKKIESTYSNTTFNSALKTADATHAVHFLISNYAYKYLTCIDVLSLLLASCIRDVGHTGVTNMFEIHTNSEKALLYNDHSPLENFHLTTAFQILSKKEYNFLSCLSPAQQSYVRRMVIELVLSTDMSKHLKVYGKFKYLLNPKTFNHELLDHRTALLQLFMKISDVSCFCKPPPTYVRWFDKRWDEFQNLGDQERALGIPISPFCERDQPPENRVKSVLVFFNYIILPQVKVLHEFDKSSLPLLQQLNTNKFDWEALYNGIHFVNSEFYSKRVAFDQIEFVVFFRYSVYPQFSKFDICYCFSFELFKYL